MTSPSVAVIVVAAGSGTRLGAGMPKAFLPVAGVPMLQRALDAVRGMRDETQVVVVAPAQLVQRAEEIGRSALPGRDVAVVAGADERQGSVARGLALVDPAVDVVLVHDAARSLTPSTQFDRVVDAVRAGRRGAIPALAVADTIKRIDPADVIVETVDRAELAAVQTPQGFPREQLVAAYAAAADDPGGVAHTDDAALVARHGHPAVVVPGDPLAFKITTPADLERAESLLAPSAVTPRVGFGSDTHAFERDGGSGAPLVLALLEWPGERRLAGHSDGDAAAHAIVDALLSAVGRGDIGSVFGTDDPRLAGASGAVFLTEARRIVEESGHRIGNVVVQIVGNRPRFAGRRAEAEDALTAVLGAPVAVSATTTDGLGATGRGVGVTAQATALVVPVTHGGGATTGR